MLSALNILFSNATERLPVVACFRPLFVEYLFPGGIPQLDSIKECAQAFNTITFSIPTWEERIQGMTEVLNNSATSPFVPRLGTTVSVLRWACWDMVNALALAHDMEETGNTDSAACLRWMRYKWRGDLEQPGCLELLATTERMLASGNYVWHDDGCLPITYYLAARLLFTLLDSDSILEGLRSLDAITTAWKLQSFIRTTERNVNFEKEEIRSFLFLAGLPLGSIRSSQGTDQITLRKKQG
jgi:hypothetical protein